MILSIVEYLLKWRKEYCSRRTQYENTCSRWWQEIIELLSIYLHNEGYESVKAYDGKSTDKIRTTSDIELLILDIMMPEMDSIQIVKELRKESQIPIIMLTAKTTDMDKIRGSPVLMIMSLNLSIH